jgi:hypothetical protein
MKISISSRHAFHKIVDTLEITL